MAMVDAITDGHKVSVPEIVSSNSLTKTKQHFPHFMLSAANSEHRFFGPYFFSIQVSVTLIVTGTCVSREISPHLRARRFEAKAVL